MSYSNIINSIGLLFDIAGSILLFLYGISPRIKEGYLGIGGDITEKEWLDKKRKNARYDYLSKLGLIFLIVGFLFQLLSNFMK